MDVAYILDYFPVYSETFIVREILTLQQNGFRVHLFARKDTSGGEYGRVIHRDAETLVRKVKYFPSFGANRLLILKAFYYFILLLTVHPVRVIKALSVAMQDGSRALRILLHSMLNSTEFNKRKIQHIHAHFALEACETAMFISMLTGIPFSFTVHAHDIFLSGRAKLMASKLKNANFIASISRYNKQHIAEKFPLTDLNKIRVIRCGIDTDRIKKNQRKKSEIFTIVSVGRLVEKKGFRYLIGACAKLKRKNEIPAFKCIVIGEGEERYELESLIRTSGLNGLVELPGAFEQSEVLRQFAHADLFVMPCVLDRQGSMDGIPVVLMEAMALGVPVISTRLSGVPELVKNGSGILVEPNAADALADAIESIIRMPGSERRQMGKIGRNIIEREFDLNKEVCKLGKLFEASSNISLKESIQQSESILCTKEKIF